MNLTKIYKGTVTNLFGASFVSSVSSKLIAITATCYLYSIHKKHKNGYKHYAPLKKFDAQSFRLENEVRTDVKVLSSFCNTKKKVDILIYLLIGNLLQNIINVSRMLN